LSLRKKFNFRRATARPSVVFCIFVNSRAYVTTVEVSAPKYYLFLQTASNSWGDFLDHFWCRYVQHFHAVCGTNIQS